jgi:phosphatidylinositol alpha-mannosyltransferase
MRILLACPYAWDAPGGVQVHVRQLAGRLRGRGHMVLVLAPSFGTPVESFVRTVGRPLRVRFNRSVAPIAPWPGSRRRVGEAVRWFHPDVVHAHEPLVPSTAMFAVLASPVPVVATFHAYADRSRALELAAPLLRPVVRRLAARLAVSRAAASFAGAPFDGEGIRVVPNGVEVETFADAEPATLPEGRRILFVNRLDPRKGFAVMVEAFRRIHAAHPDALLLVAGDGPERHAAGRLPADARSRTMMLGNVAHQRLPPYHAASEVFCAPATGRESFGIVLVEAMAAGLPVVASDIPGYREVVRQGVEGVLVPPRDPGALAGAVGRFLDHPDAARAFSAAGRERARRFSWETVTDEIEDVYREVTGGP